MTCFLINTMANNLYNYSNFEQCEINIGNNGLEGMYNDLQNECFKIEYPDVLDSNISIWYLDDIFEKQIEEKNIDADGCKKIKTLFAFILYLIYQ